MRWRHRDRGTCGALGASGLVAREVTWAAGRAPAHETPVAVRIRHRHPPMPARVAAVSAAEVHVRFEARVPPSPRGSGRLLPGDLVLAEAGSRGDPMKRVAIATLGCKVNAYDSATIAERLRAAGCRLVALEPVLTCDRQLVHGDGRRDAEEPPPARRARRLNPAARVILTGCYAQTKPNEAAASTPSIT